MDVAKTKSRMQAGNHKGNHRMPKFACKKLVQWIWKMVGPSNKCVCCGKCSQRSNITWLGTIYGKSKRANRISSVNHQLRNISELFKSFEWIWSWFVALRRRTSAEKLRKSNIQCSDGSQNKTKSFTIWHADSKWFDGILQFDSFRQPRNVGHTKCE